jgi:hypothetical protein
MGPICEVVLPFEITPETLDAIHAFLNRTTEIVKDTRRGRNWEIRLDGRPVWVSAHYSNTISFAAGCNSPEDYSALRLLSQQLATELGGESTEPSK